MSISSRLSPKDKQTLALFYEGESYVALLKLIKLVKQNAAEKALEALDFHQVKHLQGQKHSLDRLEDELKKIHEWDKKR